MQLAFQRIAMRKCATQLTALQGSISAQQLDLADLASVRAAAAELQRLPRIDYMILNAGVMVGVYISGSCDAVVLPSLLHAVDVRGL
jgi:NAD(P)-dependent dehydrogenase (short-subunit alcohol dehydrogenase family)